MNEYTLRAAILDVFGHIGGNAPADAIVAAVKRRGLDLDISTAQAARLSTVPAGVGATARTSTSGPTAPRTSPRSGRSSAG